MNLRERAKDLYTQVLAMKARHYLDSTGSKVILISGLSPQREIFKNIIAEEMVRAGVATITNLPGNNYKLGISLSLLGFTGGYSSPFRWVKLLFKKPITKGANYFVMDFSLSNNNDAEFVARYFKPYALIAATHIHNELINGSFGNILKIIPEEIISLANHDEDDYGQTCSFQMDGQNGNLRLSNFGVHYIYSSLIAKYILKHVQQKV